MKKQERLTISLPFEVAKWLDNNIKNKSGYIASLIRRDAKIGFEFKEKVNKDERKI